MRKSTLWLTLLPLCAACLMSGAIPASAERLGTIEVGKLADIVLVDGDPLTDMSDIRNVTLTVKDGTIFDPAEMYQAIGVGQ